MRRNRQIIYLAMVLLSLNACSKDEDKTAPNLPEVVHGTFVLNEGQFNANSASISYKPDGDSVIQDWFKSANGWSMGDVFHSYFENEEAYFLIINNSGKIEKVNKSNMKSLATIENLSSPRFGAIAEGTAYLTNLTLDSNVNVVDKIVLAGNSKSNSVAVKGWCEGILVHENKLYIANTAQHQLLICDLPFEGIYEVVALPKEPMNMVVDKNGMIWVLCSGGYLYGQGQAALCKFNPATKAIESTLRFSDPNAYPSKLTIDTEGQNLFLLSNGVFKINVSASEIPLNPIIAAQGYFYGLGINPIDGNIYVGDAVDFQSRGKVYVHDQMGVLKETFEAGIAPSGFIFK